MDTDRHVVIEASRQRGQEYRYRVVTPAIAWEWAQEEWTKLEDDRMRMRDAARYYMVRSATDPRWALLPHPSVFTPTTANLRTPSRGEQPVVRAARAYAATVGVTGRQGGWLYDATGRPIGQGWWQYASRMLASGRIKATGKGYTDTAWFVWASPRPEEVAA